MPKPTLEELRARVHGQTIAAGDDGIRYRPKSLQRDDRSRPSCDRALHGRRRCHGVGRVRAEHGIDLSVRGGSHSVPGFGTNDDGVVIDLAPMNGVRVDPQARTARAEGGCTWGGFNHATYAFGLATTGGIIGSTGIAGLTLGGGIGYLTRAFGLTCDNLLSADVVTADGRFLVASKKENRISSGRCAAAAGTSAWSRRSNTSCTPSRTSSRDSSFFPLTVRAMCSSSIGTTSRRRRRNWACSRRSRLRRRCRSSPRRTTARRSAFSSAAGRGGPKAPSRCSRPSAKWRPSSRKWSRRCPTRCSTACSIALLPPGLQHYWKADFASELTDGAIKAHLEHGPKVPVVNSTMHIYPINGACNRVAADATAFAYRDAKFATVIAGMWPDPADNEKNTRWVKDYYHAVHPHSSAGGYVNFMAADDQDRIRDNYKGNYDRLVADQDEVRPGQPVPHESEHQAVSVTSSMVTDRRPSSSARNDYHVWKSLTNTGRRHITMAAKTTTFTKERISGRSFASFASSETFAPGLRL